MGKNQHVVPSDGGWGIKGAGNSRMTARFNTQKEASQTARDIAINQQSEFFIHGRDGRIRERNSYGNDPFPPPRQRQQRDERAEHGDQAQDDAAGGDGAHLGHPEEVGERRGGERRGGRHGPGHHAGPHPPEHP